MSYCRVGTGEVEGVRVTFKDEKDAMKHSQEEVNKMAKEFMDYVKNKYKQKT